jgi:geranylgeranylglycerol-phosphate geranylgeranyltransferase
VFPAEILAQKGKADIRVSEAALRAYIRRLHADVLHPDHGIPFVNRILNYGRKSYSMLKDFAKLTRFEHALMLAFAVVIAETIVLGKLPPPSLLILVSVLVPVFSEMGSFALNDYFDIETDRLNKKKGPLVSGAIKPQVAMSFAIASLVVSTILAFMINNLAFMIVFAFNVFAVLYNWKLKDLPLLGNVFIGLTMAVPFIFGNYVVSTELSTLAIILASLGFVAGVAREIIKSVQDMEGDVKARGSKTIPVVIGKASATYLAVILYLLFIPLSALPFMGSLAPEALPLFLVAFADGLIAAICYKSLRGDFAFARNASLIAFFIGMLGILLAAL